MRKVSIDEVKAGMTVAADLFDPDFGGGDFPLIARGVELNDGFINKMRELGLTELLVITPPGYRGAPGEILAPPELTEDILFDGAVELDCDLPANIKIDAGEDITINGEISPGCSITSAKGGIFIKGIITGSPESPISINAAQKVSIQSQTEAPLLYAEIKSLADISITGNLAECTASAKGKLIVKGFASRSKIYSQSRIRLQESSDLCHLMVKPAECRPLFQELLALDKQLTEFKKDQAKLQNTIDLVHKLGKDIEQIPQEKRVKLALNVKQFQELKGEISFGLKQKDRLKNKIFALLGAQRIFVSDRVHANTKITIETCNLTLEQPAEAVAFFVEDMKIAQEPIN